MDTLHPELIAAVGKFVPISDIVTWRLVCKKLKKAVDSTILVGPCSMYRTDAELIAAKNSVSEFTARRFAIALRQALEKSKEIARFVNTLVSLEAYGSIRKVGAHFEGQEDVACRIRDCCGRERPWADLTEEDCDNDVYGYATVNLEIDLPGGKLGFFFAAVIIDGEWRVTLRIGDMIMLSEDMFVDEISIYQLSHCCAFMNSDFRGDYISLVSNLEVYRLALLHEGFTLRLINTKGYMERMRVLLDIPKRE